MIRPGELTNFKINFQPKEVYSTLYDLLKQFKDENINSFELEIYGYTCKRKKLSIYFINKFDEWSPESLDLSQLENFFAIIKEHDNKELFFNVLFFKPYTDVKVLKNIT